MTNDLDRWLRRSVRPRLGYIHWQTGPKSQPTHGSNQRYRTATFGKRTTSVASAAGDRTVVSGNQPLVGCYVISDWTARREPGLVAGW